MCCATCGTAVLQLSCDMLRCGVTVSNWIHLVLKQNLCHRKIIVQCAALKMRLGAVHIAESQDLAKMPACTGKSENLWYYVAKVMVYMLN